MTGGQGEVRLVQRVEVELVDPAIGKLVAKFGRDIGGDQVARTGIVVEPHRSVVGLAALFYLCVVI